MPRDRSLERVLPKEYRGMWEGLGEAEKKKAEAAAAREAAAERKKAVEKKKREREARKAPTVRPSLD
eukprot:scaffold234646_cov38-Prasinocladus_malaysianus.AAC.1